MNPNLAFSAAAVCDFITCTAAASSDGQPRRDDHDQVDMVNPDIHFLYLDIAVHAFERLQHSFEIRFDSGD